MIRSTAHPRALLSINGRDKARLTHQFTKAMANLPFLPARDIAGKLVAHGMTNKEIAAMMGGLPEQSVKNSGGPHHD